MYSSEEILQDDTKKGVISLWNTGGPFQSNLFLYAVKHCLEVAFFGTGRPTLSQDSQRTHIQNWPQELKSDFYVSLENFHR